MTCYQVERPLALNKRGPGVVEELLCDSEESELKARSRCWKSPFSGNVRKGVGLSGREFKDNTLLPEPKDYHRRRQVKEALDEARYPQN